MAVRVYMACSLDGFIAGKDNDLSFLHEDHKAPGDLEPDDGALRFEPFLEQIGAMLMGRTTFDVVQQMGVWPYAELPVLVASTRTLEPLAPSVRRVDGNITALLEQACSLAGDKDVYLDGGDLIRQALNAGLVDEITATLVPVLLGSGTRLFDGLQRDSKWQFTAHRYFGDGMLQWTARRRP